MIADYILIFKILYSFYFQGRIETAGQHQETAAMNTEKEVSRHSNTDAPVEDGAGSKVVVDADPNLLYDLEKAMAESRRTTPNLLSQDEMQERGIEFMARLGIKCVRPAYAIPMNGDCLWSCCYS